MVCTVLWLGTLPVADTNNVSAVARSCTRIDGYWFNARDGVCVCVQGQQTGLLELGLSDDRAVDCDAMETLSPRPEGNEAPQQTMWARNLKPRPEMQVDKARHVIAQHGSLPGQHCATCRSMATSTLAW
jgi:hypothetical protein